MKSAETAKPRVAEIFDEFVPDTNLHETTVLSMAELGCSVLTCSCTSVTWHYWTSNSNFWSTSTAWLVYFVDGDVNAFDKTDLHHVRAVRAGL